MKISKNLIGLASLAGLLALIAALAGLLWPDGGQPFTFTTLHGQEVEMFGRGLYRHDSKLSAATYLGTDAATLLLMVPLLAYALWRYRRGSLRGGLLLVAVLSSLLYNSIHMAMAAAYNPMFLLYVVFFSASLYAFIMAFTAIDLGSLPARLSAGMPRRGPAIFLFVAGIALALVWLSDLIPAMLQNQPPVSLGSATTLVTYAVDLAVIVPATLLAGILLLRRDPLGIVLGMTLIVLNAIVGIVVASQTVVMFVLGVPLTPAVVLVFVTPFILMALFAAWFTIRMLKNIEDTGTFAEASASA
jgi:hypothetical protein